jgi:integrase
VHLTKWLEGIPTRLRNHLQRIGLLNPQRVAASKPLKEHLEDFRRSIGDTTKHARCTYNAIVRLFEDCKFTHWSDIQASRLDDCLKQLKVSQRTGNFYLKAAKQFCKWMVKDRRATESPLEHLSTIKITERKRQRRALLTDKLRALLEATEAAPERFGMTGPERAMLYRLAVETGLRANELRSLKTSSFDLDNCTVEVLAGYSKNKKSSVLPLRPDTAATLREFLANKLPEAQVFKVPEKTAKMIRADLSDAQIPYKDEAGRVFDFHALRHQTGTLLAAAGVHPKDAQAIMRHSDINLTMQIYTHMARGAEAAAVAKMPSLSMAKDKSRKNSA